MPHASRTTDRTSPILGIDIGGTKLAVAVSTPDGMVLAEARRPSDATSGPDGIIARPPVTAHPQGYVYDLWLVERLADRMGA